MCHRETQQVTNKTLADIQIISHSTPAQFLRLRSEIATTGTTLQAIRDASTPMQNTLGALAPLITSQSDDIRARIFETSQASKSDFSRLETSMEVSLRAHKVHLEQVEARQTAQLDRALPQIEELLAGAIEMAERRALEYDKNLQVRKLESPIAKFQLTCLISDLEKLDHTTARVSPQCFERVQRFTYK